MSRDYHTPGARILHLAADRSLDAASQAAAVLGRDSVSVGVTGLSRSGKTIFTTTALNNLSHAKRFDLFSPIAEGRFQAAHFQSPPSATTPRFPFEKNLDALYEAPPRWPQSTSRINQIQLKIRYEPTRFIGKMLSGLFSTGAKPSAALTVNLTDYPGEWLTDLPLLSLNFRQWSEQTIAAAKTGARASLSGAWLTALADAETNHQYDQRLGTQLYEQYARYLRACKDGSYGLSRLQPGRFLVPGDLEGSSALTFCPLPSPLQPKDVAKGSLYSEFSARFEAYKANVIAPFFDEHLSRIDRQILLVDLLGAINGGIEAVEELRQTLKEILAFFRPGQNNPMQTLFSGRRVERLLFAASKADHIHSSQHAAMTSLLESLLFDSSKHAAIEGASVKVSCISALRAALPKIVRREGKDFECVVGVPRGEVNTRVYFPGVLPNNWRALQATLRAEIGAQSGKPSFGAVQFEPPRDLVSPEQGLPQLRVDEALSFLIGDLL